MLRIIFAGTPEFAVPALEALLQSEHDLVAVYTQPDRPAGRGRKLQASPVKSLALRHQVPILQPTNFNDPADVGRLRGFDADLMVVAAYGLLLPAAVLEAPRLGCVNIHASLLPRWRGASPIQQAILAGDKKSGITLMKMDRGLDTGDMIACASIDIDPAWSAGDLHDALAPLGAALLLESLADIDTALAAARPQDEARTCYAPRLSKSQAEVDWSKTRDELVREVRAFNPWPVSYSYLDGENLRLWAALAGETGVPGETGEVVRHDNHGLFVRCGDGLLQVTELQFAGRGRLSAAQALNARNLCGARLGRRDE